MAVTLAKRVDELVEKHGSLRNAAKVLGTDAGYLSRIRSGQKTGASAQLLRRMGLRKVVTYEYREGVKA